MNLGQVYIDILFIIKTTFLGTKKIILKLKVETSCMFFHMHGLRNRRNTLVTDL